MKTLLMILSIILLMGCTRYISDAELAQIKSNKAKELGYYREVTKTPEPPYGTPDKTDNYDTSDYESVTYTYFCYNEQYVAITYSCSKDNWNWNKTIYTSACIK